MILWGKVCCRGGGGEIDLWVIEDEEEQAFD